MSNSLDFYINFDPAGATKGVDQAAKEAKRAEAEYQKITASVGKLTSALDLQRAKVKQQETGLSILADKLAAARKKEAELADTVKKGGEVRAGAVEAAAQSTKKLAAQYDVQAAKVRQAVSNEQQLATGLKRVKDEQIKLAESSKKATKELDKTNNELKEQADNSKKAEVGLAGYMAVLAGVAVGVKVFKDLTAAMAENVKFANEQEKQEAKLAAVIRATGGAAGFSAKEIGKYASDLQGLTTFGDEVTISAAAILATFKQIKGDEFKRTLAAAQDLSTVLESDLKSSVLQLGKALEDPTTGLNALRRAGISFTDEEKDTIKALQESGKLREAQIMVLAKVEEQVGGTAKAMRKEFGGAIEATDNAFGDLREELGFFITKNSEVKRSVGSIEDGIISLTGKINKYRESEDNIIKSAVGFVARNKELVAGLGLVAGGFGTATAAITLYNTGLGAAVVANTAAAASAVASAAVLAAPYAVIAAGVVSVGVAVNEGAKAYDAYEMKTAAAAREAEQWLKFEDRRQRASVAAGTELETYKDIQEAYRTGALEYDKLTDTYSKGSGVVREVVKDNEDAASAVSLAGEAVQGALKKAAVEIPAASHGVKDFADASGTLETTWKQIDGVWTEVLPNGVVLLDDMTESVKVGAEATEGLKTTVKNIGGVWQEVLPDGTVLTAALKQEMIGAASATDKLGTASEKAGKKSGLSAKEAEKAWKDYLKTVSSVADQIEQRTGLMGLSEDLDALKSSQLSAAEGYQQIKDRVAELGTAAQAAFAEAEKLAAQGDTEGAEALYEEALKYADEAKDKAKELNTAVEDGDKTIISQKEGFENATAAVTEYGELGIEILEKWKETAQEAADTLDNEFNFSGLNEEAEKAAETAGQVGESLSEGIKDGVADALPEVAALDAALDAAAQDRTARFTIEERTVQAAFHGALIRGPNLSNGGQVSGPTGYDSVHALLAGNEAVTQGKIVRELGYNRVMRPINDRKYDKAMQGMAAYLGPAATRDALAQYLMPPAMDMAMMAPPELPRLAPVQAAGSAGPNFPNLGTIILQNDRTGDRFQVYAKPQDAPKLAAFLDDPAIKRHGSGGR